METYLISLGPVMSCSTLNQNSLLCETPIFNSQMFHSYVKSLGCKPV